jgi:hypothetical protein
MADSERIDDTDRILQIIDTYAEKHQYMKVDDIEALYKTDNTTIARMLCKLQSVDLGRVILHVFPITVFPLKGVIFYDDKTNQYVYEPITSKSSEYQKHTDTFIRGFSDEVKSLRESVETDGPLFKRLTESLRYRLSSENSEREIRYSMGKISVSVMVTPICILHTPLFHVDNAICETQKVPIDNLFFSSIRNLPWVLGYHLKKAKKIILCDILTAVEKENKKILSDLKNRKSICLISAVLTILAICLIFFQAIRVASILSGLVLFLWYFFGYWIVKDDYYRRIREFRTEAEVYLPENRKWWWKLFESVCEDESEKFVRYYRWECKLDAIAQDQSKMFEICDERWMELAKQRHMESVKRKSENI